MKLKADSFKQYNEAAVIEMIVRILPEVAGKVSEPLAKTEKIVIINSGNGPGGGASKLTGDITQIISQLPPVIESLTGIKFEKLLQQVPALKNAMGGEPNPRRRKEGVNAAGTAELCVSSMPFWMPIIARSPATAAPASMSPIFQRTAGHGHGNSLVAVGCQPEPRGRRRLRPGRVGLFLPSPPPHLDLCHTSQFPIFVVDLMRAKCSWRCLLVH